ncbi:MAG: hypothetical protein IH602_21570 [Bryobacteraceae bacterium]|nr:hypothetical protein [Bryobacteraceae bacterium]
MHGRLLANLKVLAEQKVKFAVVGGIGAMLQGCPLSTLDLDIVHERSPENIARLMQALDSVDAVYRTQPARKLRPSAEALSGPGHHLLLTRNGPLDVLGEIGDGHGYGELEAFSDEIILGGDTAVLVLRLEWIIRTKEEVGGVKDLATLDLLRASLAQQKKHASGEADSE